MSWLTEVVLLGSSDARVAELSVSEDTSTLLELALGSSREPAGGLWRKMKDYAFSRGTVCVCVCTVHAHIRRKTRQCGCPSDDGFTSSTGYL